MSYHISYVSYIVLYVASFFRHGPRNVHRCSYKAVCKIVISKRALKGLQTFFSTTSKRQVLLIMFGQTDGAAVIVVPRDCVRVENN